LNLLHPQLYLLELALTSHHNPYHLCNVLQQNRYHLCNALHHHR
jgi:hypothetical protein